MKSAIEKKKNPLSV